MRPWRSSWARAAWPASLSACLALVVLLVHILVRKPPQPDLLSIVCMVVVFVGGVVLLIGTKHAIEEEHRR